MTLRTLSASLLSLLVLAPLAGCRIEEHKNASNGKGDNVDISTPFGGMHVRTDDAANASGIGLTVYPGAVPAKEEDGKDKDSADVNLSFGDFHLGVKAATYQTQDSPDKVEAFYRKDMAHYGEVLKCVGSSPVGQPTRTSQGLTCKEDGSHNDHANIHVMGDDGETELRTGSPSHQHVVGLKAKNGGTRIGLVMLDLPKDIHGHGDSESE